MEECLEFIKFIRESRHIKILEGKHSSLIDCTTKIQVAAQTVIMANMAYMTINNNREDKLQHQFL